MAVFEYTACDSIGNKFDGVYTDVENLNQLKDELDKMGYKLVKARKQKAIMRNRVLTFLLVRSTSFKTPPVLIGGVFLFSPRFSGDCFVRGDFSVLHTIWLSRDAYDCYVDVLADAPT